MPNSNAPISTHLVQEREFWIVRGVTARHPTATKHELWQERQVESDEHDCKAEMRPPSSLYILPNIFRPPVEYAAQESDECSTHHHIVKVSHDKVRVVQVHVGCQRTQVQAGQSTDREQER